MRKDSGSAPAEYRWSGRTDRYFRAGKNIRAVLNISQPGQAGGYAVADILFGKAVPSGKLTATWARHGIIRQRILMDTGTEIWKRKNTGGNFRWIPSF